MRIAFWASATLTVFLSAAAAITKVSVPLPSGGTICCSSSRSKTRLDIRTSEGAWYILSLERDTTVSPKSGSSLFQVGDGAAEPSGEPQRGLRPSKRSFPAMR